MTLTGQLASLVAGLTYTSESDRPFAVVDVADPAPDAPLDAATLARALGIDAATPVELRTIDAMLARHTHRTDPYDVATQRVRPRYEALQAFLETTLREATGVRAGRVEVRCWLVGRDGRGRLLGVQTVAIET
jgi:hypothetical protein